MLGQLFVWEKYDPVILIPRTFSVEAPLFVRVAVSGGVQPPPTKRATQAKSILPGLSVTGSGSKRIEMVYEWEADWLAESVTLMLNPASCTAISGVPEIVTVLVALLLNVRL